MRRQSWVKEGRWPKQCVALRVHKKAEISQKPVSIEDDGVKNEHVFQSIPEVLSKGAVVVQNSLHAPALHDLAHRHERDVLAREKLASGAQGAFPACERVGDGMNSKYLSYLPGVEFGVGLVARVRGTLCAALVEENPAILASPALAEHAVGCELRA